MLPKSANRTPKICFFKFSYGCQKPRIWCYFKTIEKVVTKLLYKKLLAWKCKHYIVFHVWVLCAKVLSPLTFFVQTFLLLFQQLQTLHRILHFWYPYQNFVTKISHISTFCKLLKAECAWNGSKKVFYKCDVSHNLFWIHLWVRTLSFIKKGQNCVPWCIWTWYIFGQARPMEMWLY